MSIKLHRVRDLVNGRIRNYDLRGNDAGPAYSDIEVDQELCSEYLAIAAQLPGNNSIYTASAFTITAGLDTFQLPATVTQWTANDGGAEYQSGIRIQLVSIGTFLHRVSLDHINALRWGQPSPGTGYPYCFTLYEEGDQDVQGICYPPAKNNEPCNLFRNLMVDDLRDFIGSGTDDMDDVEVQMSRNATLALELRTSAGLVAKMDPDDLKARRLNANVVQLWLQEAQGLIIGEAGRRNLIRDSRPYRYQV